MTFVGLAWANAGGADIHLIPGLVSPELKRLLRARDEDPTTHVMTEKQLFDVPGLTVSFAAQLAGTPASHGLSLTFSTTGGLEVGVDTAAMAGRSFIVTATGTVPAAGGNPAITSTTRILMMVHASIASLWLTPKQLTVRKGAKSMRLSVLAKFDDDVIADISNWAPFEPPGIAVNHIFVRPKGSDTPELQWKADGIPPGGTPVVAADPVTGVLDATADTGSATISVTNGVKTASAIVVCGPPWSTPVRLTLLPGSRGDREINFVPNILFLPEGFQEADRNDYERMVRMVVTRLSTRNRTRPYAAFTGRINYFMGWVASPDPGVSVLNELDRASKTATETTGAAVPLPSVTRRAPAQWKIEDLINAVGLPTPGVDKDGSVLDDARIAIWQAVYGPFITKAAVQPLFPAWLTLNDRVLLNERDTAFHMGFGARPTLDTDADEHVIQPNPRRGDPADFITFLDALVNSRGSPLNKLWTTGKDKGLVVMLCRSIRDAGARVKFVAMSLGQESMHHIKAIADGTFELKPDAVPTEVFHSVWLTAAHELGHVMTLGDEYGVKTGGPTLRHAIDIRQRPNIQLRSELVDPAGNIGNVDLIKWASWPRIAKGGVLAVSPAPAAGGNFTLTLNEGKAAGFRQKDIVRLRTRPLAAATGTSDRLKVESVSGDTMVVAPLGAAVLDPTKFPAGSVVIAPVRAKDPDPAADKYGDDLTLANEDVLAQRIGLTGNPLNANPGIGEGKPPNDVGNRPCRDVAAPYPMPATNFPDRKAPKPPKYSSWTIGLYDNGGEFFCGVFHPTGVCIMNDQSRLDPKTRDLNIYDFCLICRYAMVDAVDPTVYGAVEDDYRERYT